MSIQSYFNGLLTGLVLGVLIAPGSGAETRRKLVRRANRLKSSVNNSYGVFKDELSKQVTNLENEEKINMGDNMQSALT